MESGTFHYLNAWNRLRVKEPIRWLRKRNSSVSNENKTFSLKTETTMIQNKFPVPSVSVYNKWTPEKLKKNHTFSNAMLFFSFFFPRNNQTQEILYSIFFCQSWWPTCCFGVCDSFDEREKKLGYSSGLGFPLTSYKKSSNNTNIIKLLKQSFKDRKCSLDLKTFL